MRFNGITKYIIIVTVLCAAALINNLFSIVNDFPDMFKTYDQKSKTHLDKQDYKDETLVSFKLDSSKDVSFRWTVKDINTKYIDIKLVGQNGYSTVLLHGEEFWTNSSRESSKFKLDQGEYKVILNSVKSKGELLLYYKVE